MKVRLSLPLAFSIFMGSSCSRVSAQGTDLGSIRGTVTDPSGAQIPGAAVVVTDLSTRIARSFTTGEHGNFEATALPSGHYRVTISSPGFGTSTLEGLTLNGSDAISANATLQLRAETSVDVSGDASIINTEDSTLSQTLTPVAIIELPRDSRDIYQFLYINPNVTQSGTSGDFKFLGGQSYGASFSVDGQRTNGGIFGQATQSKPSLESVGDFNVLSNGFSAEYAGIANIRVTTKRGGAQFHGSLFYNNKNSALAAWTIADKSAAAMFAPSTFQTHYPNPSFNITDAGGSIGGPVPHLRRTFFFAAFEHNWTVQPSSTGRNNSLPHPTLLAGDFSRVSDAQKPFVPADVNLSASEIATDTVGGLGQQFITIPQRLLNPVVQKLFSTYYPSIGSSAPIDAATGHVVGYQTSIPGRSGSNMGDLRIDHDISDNDRIYGVYHASSENDALSAVAAPITGLGLSQTDRLNNALSLSYTHLFNQRLVNEARGGFNRQYLYTHSNTTLRSFLQSIGFSEADIAAYGAVVGTGELDTHGNPAVNISNFQGLGSGGRNTDRPLSQNLITFGDTLNWTVGRHNLRLGADVVRNQAEDGFASGRGSPRGAITYSGSGTTALGNLLLGEAPSSATYIALPRPATNVSNWETGVFAQDDFRVNQRLTINLGLRYDLFSPFVEKNDIIANFSPDVTNPVSGLKGAYVLPSNKTLQYVDPSIIAFGYVLAGNSGLGVGRSLVRPDRSDINPRIGAAFRITDRSVLRGGYGIFTPTSTAHVIRDPIATNPFNQTYTKRSVDGGPPLQGWPVGNTGSGTSPNAGGTPSGFGNTPAANSVPAGLRNPRLQQWNATFEQQLPFNSSIRASYIGAYITGEIVGRDLNMLPPSDQLFGITTGDGVTICDPTQGNCAYSAQDRARFRFPALGDFVTQFGNNGHGLTNSFQAQLQRQTRGFTVSVAYTYLDQKSTGVDTDNDSLGGDAYNPFDPNSDYGTDSFVSHHRVVAYGVFDLPVGRGHRYAGNITRVTDALIGGWQTTFNMFAKTGTGFTPFFSCGDCDPVFPGNVASGAIDAVGDFSGGFRPTRIADAKAGAGKLQWNPAAFGFPDVGSTLFSNPNNVVRNSLTGPGTWGANLGVHKNFAITERVQLQIGADADNIFNHPLLSPDSSGADDFSNLGTFNVHLNPQTGAIQPLSTEFIPNPDFGLKYQSYTQEGIDNRRSIRIRGRITF